MITRLDQKKDGVLGFRMSGRLHDEDFQYFVPTVEAAIKDHGKVRLLAQMEDFHGWDMRAMWDDVKFCAKHYSDIDRIAMVGDHLWEKWMAMLCKPFTRAQVR